MKSRKLLFTALAGFIGVAIMTSCGGGGNQQTTTDETTVQESAISMDDQLARGEQIYNEKCFACHQANGQGIPNAFPTLTGSDFLLNNTKMAVAQVLNGSAAVPSHGDIKYPAPMPPQVDNYEDAVAVINYVLKNFDNNGKTITVDEVKDIEIAPR
ncbi:MAG: cytochrome c [Lentimicrobium sp.]|jgi:nitrite reductase (NO-forming)|nr:cytochrome c [Lentimicrobium sp.]